jgi:hypothetical protein
MTMKGKKANPGAKRNVWKIVSVVFISLFILILLWGITNLRSRPQFPEPTQEQTDMAVAVVTDDLQASGDSIDNYEVSVANRMIGFIGRPGPRNGMPGLKPGGHPDMARVSGENIQVALRGNSTGHLYIVDLESGSIVMHSFTEWFNG